MAIEINIPSQIKKYLSVAFFPATGNDFTLYIANDTNRLYQWSGSAYVEVSQQDAVNWGSIGGDIINQTDLQLAFASMIPYTGATNDVNIGNYDMYVNKLWLYDAVNDNYGSTHYTDGNYHIEDADGHKLLVIEDGFVQIHKTDTIQSNLYTSGLTVTRDHYLPDASGTLALTSDIKITIGTTAIASGTVGRVLFEGTGNVVQESANLFWDNTNGRLGIGTSSPAAPLQITTSGLVTALYINTGNDGGFTSQNNGTLALNRTTQVRLVNGSTIFGANDRTYQLVNIGKSSTDADFYVQYWNGASYLERFRVFSTGNFSIGTTTDAGFRLDVNGTARVQSGLANNSSATAFQVTGASSSLFRIRGFGDVYLEGSTPAIFYGSSGTFVGGGSANFYSGQGVGNTFFSVIHNNSNVAIRALSNSNVLLNPSAGNVLIGTTTDAGFRLDVNGTARVSGRVEIQNTSGLNIRTTVGAVSTAFRPVGTDAEIRTNDASVASAYFYQNGNVGFSQRVVFGSTTLSAASAQVQIDSTTRGFLPPRMTTTERNAITSPAAGLMVYDTTLNVIMYYNGTSWI